MARQRHAALSSAVAACSDCCTQSGRSWRHRASNWDASAGVRIYQVNQLAAEVSQLLVFGIYLEQRSDLRPIREPRHIVGLGRQVTGRQSAASGPARPPAGAARARRAAAVPASAPRLRSARRTSAGQRRAPSPTSRSARGAPATSNGTPAICIAAAIGTTALDSQKTSRSHVPRRGQTSRLIMCAAAASAAA